MPGIAEMYAQASKHHQEGRLAEAEQLYHRILETDPQHADSHNLLGLLELQRGHPRKAATCVRHALSLKPSDAGFHRNLGLVYKKLNKLEDAVTAYQEALRLKPDSAEAHSVLGTLLPQLGRLDEAVTHCHEAVRLQPGDADGHNNLGVALVKQAKVDEATAQFKSAIECNPQCLPAHNNLASVLAEQGQWDQAIEQYQLALEIDPNNAQAYAGLGRVFVAAGRSDQDTGVLVQRMARRLAAKLGPGKYDFSHLTQKPDGMVMGPIQDDEALLLFAVCKVTCACRVAEFGGAAGYSARNFLQALKDRPNGKVYTVDRCKVKSLSAAHRVILKSAKDVLPADFDNEKLDLVFFDCHDCMQQLEAFHRLSGGGIITRETVIAVHDTGTHPAKFCAWAYRGVDGYIHQQSERQFVNHLQDSGYECLSFHAPRPLPPLVCRHGLTLCLPKGRFVNDKLK